jgi:hypothetical protein
MRTPWPTAASAEAEKASSIPVIGSFPASASRRGGSGRRGEASVMLGGAQGSLQRRGLAVAGARVSGEREGESKGREEEKQGGARGSLRASLSPRPEGQRRRSWLTTAGRWHRAASERPPSCFSSTRETIRTGGGLGLSGLLPAVLRGR